MDRKIWLYAGLMAVLMIILQYTEYKYTIRDLSMELLITIVAIIFVGIGIWLGRNLMSSSPKKSKVSTEPMNPESQLEILNISSREYEVLQSMNRGLSNREIADELHISLSTVKTHISNLYQKLDVKRRTQAIRKAQELRLLEMYNTD